MHESLRVTVPEPATFAIAVAVRPISANARPQQSRWHTRRLQAAAMADGRLPLSGPLYVRVVWFQLQRSPGDVDNIAKRILDSLKGIDFLDDKEIDRCPDPAVRRRVDDALFHSMRVGFRHEVFWPRFRPCWTQRSTCCTSRSDASGTRRPASAGREANMRLAPADYPRKCENRRAHRRAQQEWLSGRTRRPRWESDVRSLGSARGRTSGLRSQGAITSKGGIDEVAELRQAAFEAQVSEFRLVIVTPPRATEVSIESLESELSRYLVDNPPLALDEMFSNPRVECCRRRN